MLRRTMSEEMKILLHSGKKYQLIRKAAVACVDGEHVFMFEEVAEPSQTLVQIAAEGFTVNEGDYRTNYPYNSKMWDAIEKRLAKIEDMQKDKIQENYERENN